MKDAAPSGGHRKTAPNAFPFILNFMGIQRNTSAEQQQGTKQRVAACRKRLRRRRALQRAFKLAQDEAVMAANEILALIPGDVDFAEGEDDFDEAGAPGALTPRRFTPEVDRRARLRAR